MAVNPFDQVRGTPPPITRTPLTGVITKVTSEGVYVAPLGGDHRTPIGPCRGGTGLQVGATCLLIWTQEQPWALAG